MSVTPSVAGEITPNRNVAGTNCPWAPSPGRSNVGLRQTVSVMPKFGKKLFFNPTPDTNPRLKELEEALMNEMQVDYDVDVNLKADEKEAHEERIKNLRELQKTVDEENWMFTPVDKLLGLQ